MKTLLITLLLLGSNQVLANNKLLEAKENCLNNTELIINASESEKYRVECENGFQHYNSTAYREFYDKKAARESGDLKIGNFNVWHPGKSNTRFKDYALVARIINRYDVLSALELLPNVAEEAQINARVAKELKTLREQRNNAQRRWNISYRNTARRGSIAVALQMIKRQIKEVSSTYKTPGYLLILKELRKLDPSWALLLSPYGEGAKATDVQELTGIFYRASKVKPFPNRYCLNYVHPGEGRVFGCYPSFDKNFFGKEVASLFSRRPFMANFESGNFDFTLLASHVVFESPKDKSRVSKILENAFGVKEISEIGEGVTKSNFARFAEVVFMKELKKKLEGLSEKDIILAGDFNLEAKNPFWEKIIGDNALLIEGKTSVSENLFNSGFQKTEGVASNYDHFLVNENFLRECDLSSASLINFSKDEEIENYMQENYIIREQDVVNDILISQKIDANLKIEEQVEKLRNKLDGEKRMLRGKVVARYSQEEKSAIIFDYKRRIFGSQFGIDSYYRVYKEIISDHLPIGMNCKVDMGDDDSRL